jgi:hypothetical protein
VEDRLGGLSGRNRYSPLPSARALSIPMWLLSTRTASAEMSSQGSEPYVLSYSRCSWSTRLVCDPGPFTAIHHDQCLYEEAYRRCSPGSLMDLSLRYVLTRVIGSSLKSRSDLESPTSA